MIQEPAGDMFSKTELTLVRVALKAERDRALHYAAGLNPLLGDNAYIISRSKLRARKIEEVLKKHFSLPPKDSENFIEHDPTTP